MVAHACNHSTWEAEEGGLLWIPGQPELHSEPQPSMGYGVKESLSQKEKERVKREEKEIEADVREEFSFTSWTTKHK